MDTSTLSEIETLARKDIREAAIRLSDREARFLVDTYYMIQKQRIRGGNQLKALEQAGEPNAMTTEVAAQFKRVEDRIKIALDYYSSDHPLGKWPRAQLGIGPVLAAGLLAHIDWESTNSASRIWSFAGLANVAWERGEKRPWNAALKVLTWKVGESFVKVSGNPKSYYGAVYVRRKLYEQQANAAGKFADQVAASLNSRRWKKGTDAYAFYSGEWARIPRLNADLKAAIDSAVAGIPESQHKTIADNLRIAQPLRPMLPPARIHLRATRYAVKLFLAHMFEVSYKILHDAEPPKPYAIAYLNHADYLKPPP